MQATRRVLKFHVGVGESRKLGYVYMVTDNGKLVKNIVVKGVSRWKTKRVFNEFSIPIRKSDLDIIASSSDYIEDAVKDLEFEFVYNVEELRSILREI